MVEVGVAAFALLTMVALLPLGMKINQVTTEKSRASKILTALETILRNTPALPGARVGEVTGLSKVLGFVETMVTFPAPEDWRRTEDGGQNERLHARPPGHCFGRTPPIRIIFSSYDNPH